MMETALQENDAAHEAARRVGWREADPLHLASAELRFPDRRRGEDALYERMWRPSSTFIALMGKPAVARLRGARVWALGPSTGHLGALVVALGARAAESGDRGLAHERYESRSQAPHALVNSVLAAPPVREAQLRRSEVQRVCLAPPDASRRLVGRVVLL